MYVHSLCEIISGEERAREDTETAVSKARSGAAAETKRVSPRSPLRQRSLQKGEDTVLLLEPPRLWYLSGSLSKLIPPLR